MQGGAGVHHPFAHGIVEAMLDVVLDELALGIGHRPLHRMELLGQRQAITLLLQHDDDAAQVPFRPLQARGDGGVAGVSHALYPILVDRIYKLYLSAHANLARRRRGIVIDRQPP
jgi:hypothetical protein